MDRIDERLIDEIYQGLDDATRRRIDGVVAEMMRCKDGGGKIVVVTGSGPNLHEGVTTLIAELVRQGVVDGVVTSSAVVAHEMAGSLDRVKRVKGETIGVPQEILPKGAIFEITLLDDETLVELRKEMVIDEDLVRRARETSGEIIVKAAGNMGYPMGLRTEKIARKVEAFAVMTGQPFEYIAGLGADSQTMIGAGAQKGVPVIVSVPQLIGGGMVGLSIGDTMSMKRRSAMIAQILSEAEVIIESGVALTQEIHDGPFETYTGHGIWSAWEQMETYSLRDKTLVRIDLDPNLERAWRLERDRGDVQQSIDRGLPKTKTLEVPFRMEMSGFTRLEGSIPIQCDLGRVWPIIGLRVCKGLGIDLGFLSYPQETDRGAAMRDWIVENIRILNRDVMIKRAKAVRAPKEDKREGAH
jgi:deoxyhypusine synthase